MNVIYLCLTIVATRRLVVASTLAGHLDDCEHFLQAVQDEVAVTSAEFRWIVHIEVGGGQRDELVALLVPELEHCAYYIAGRAEILGIVLTSHLVDKQVAAGVWICPPVDGRDTVTRIYQRHLGGTVHLDKHLIALPLIRHLIDLGDEALDSAEECGLTRADWAIEHDALGGVQLAGSTAIDASPHPLV